MDTTPGPVCALVRVELSDETLLWRPLCARPRVNRSWPWSLDPALAFEPTGRACPPPRALTSPPSSRGHRSAHARAVERDACPRRTHLRDGPEDEVGKLLIERKSLVQLAPNARRRARRIARMTGEQKS